MKRIGQFIYSWGNGHYSRMMLLDEELAKYSNGWEVHYSSKDDIYRKLLKRFPEKRQYVHEILMPTPIDGRYGPSITLSMLNFLLPVRGSPPLVRQVSSYLREEAKLFNSVKFDLSISDGDMGPNILARNRGIKSIFVTNQFKPKLWRSHSYFYPGVLYIAKQIARATKIVVADSPPPYTICEYNLNFPDSVKEKVVYAGHFAKDERSPPA
ncbi:MAG: glycosyltransferase, partial [Candidatus Nitrosotenuis sp.]|nr:glycosyltransferase [Candidatus Nitrosotenuis sp.]